MSIQDDPGTGAEGAAASSAADVDERDQLWAEFEAEEAGEDLPDGEEDQTATEDEDDAEDLGDQGHEDDAEKAKTEGDEPEAKTEPTDDPAQLKAQIERLEHQLKSTEGRLKSSTRTVNELRQRISEGTRDVADAKKALATAKAAQPRIAKAKDEYGDAVAPLAEAMSPLLQQQEREVQRNERQLTRDREALEGHMRAEQELFLKEHADGFDSIRPKQAEFEAWVADQPKKIRDAFDANKTGIVDHVSAAHVVSLWKQELAKQGGQEGKQGKSGTDPNPKPNGKRERQLNGARTARDPASTSTVTDGPAGDSREADWDFWERQDARKAKQR